MGRVLLSAIIDFIVLYVNLQRDIELRELRDLGTTIVQQIGSLAAKQPELTSTIQLLFSQVSLYFVIGSFHKLGTILLWGTQLYYNHSLLFQAGLPPPPSPTASRMSSAPSSARSSTSQLSMLSGR